MTTRIAIFSDMHGNSAASKAVLAEIDAEAPDEVICLGDLVGYGARPNEVIDLIRETIRSAEGLPNSFARDIETGGKHA